MRLMKEPRGGLFSWYSYFSNYPLFLVLRVAVKRLQSKITQNTEKQTLKEIKNWTSQDWRQDRGGAWVTKEES